MPSDILSDLAFRGLAYQQTNADGLRLHLAEPRAVYCGFDATAPSLTIGNLVPLLLLARFQRAGHRPVVLLGGGTSLIGDPSGKSAERTLRTHEEVERNIEGQRRIFERVVDFSGSNPALMVNNADWLSKLGFLEMLREVGKHFSVNMMIQKDSVRDRLAREQGISFTEFSYPLLQSYDFRYLLDTHQVTLQVAGADQWGNIVTGVDLIRRTRQVEAFGLTAPLVTRADGGKFGKTESGAIWLTSDRTSAYAFYQFWLNVADADVPHYLKTFTFFDHVRLEELTARHAENPGERSAQRALAAEVTEIVHGPTARAHAEATTRALFSGDVAGLSREALADAFEQAPSVDLEREKLRAPGIELGELLVLAGAAKSKREARELVASGAISLNGQKAAVDQRVDSDALLHGELLLIRRGKKSWHVVRAR